MKSAREAPLAGSYLRGLGWNCLQPPKKPRQNIRPRFAGAQPDAVLEAVQRHSVEAVVREERHQRVTIEVVQVLVGQTHTPRPEPRVRGRWGLARGRTIRLLPKSKSPTRCPLQILTKIGAPV